MTGRLIAAACLAALIAQPAMANKVFVSNEKGNTRSKTPFTNNFIH